MAKVLVVGAGGQVGRQLVRVLGPEHCIPAVRTSRPGELVIDLEMLAAEPSRARDVVPEDVSAIYCVGGATDVERCETSPEWAMNINCHGPLALAAAFPHLPFLYFSTDYVFDGKRGPYRESDPVHALSGYGRSKLCAEEALTAQHPRALIVRTNVVYGPDPAGKNFLYSLSRSLEAGIPMRVITDQISTPTYNADLAEAAVALMSSQRSGIFHVSGPEAVSRFDFAVIAARILGLDERLILPVTTADLHGKAPRPLRGGLRNERLAQTLPETHMRPIDAGVRAWNETRASAASC